MSIKERTISGILWNSVSRMGSMILELIIGIILARILSPKEFGLIGMIAIFIAISQIFVNSGFRQALIRKRNAQNLTIQLYLFLI